MSNPTTREKELRLILLPAELVPDLAAQIINQLNDLIESELTLREKEVRERRDGELIIMMDEVEKKEWTLRRFLATFCALYEKNYGHALPPTSEDNSN